MVEVSWWFIIPVTVFHRNLMQTMPQKSMRPLVTRAEVYHVHYYARCSPHKSV